MSSRGAGPGPVTSDIWIFDVQSGLPTRFTFDPGNEYSVAWSQDSRSVAFNSSRKGRLDIYQKAADGSGAEQELLIDDQSKFPVEWSPDGRFLLFTVNPAGRGAGSAWSRRARPSWRGHRISADAYGSAPVGTSDVRRQDTVPADAWRHCNRVSRRFLTRRPLGRLFLR